MKEACENCRYVGRNHDNPLLRRKMVYTCRRYPPIVVGSEHAAFGKSHYEIGFPQIDKDAWCGEYAPQETEADEP